MRWLGVIGCIGLSSAILSGCGTTDRNTPLGAGGTSTSGGSHSASGSESGGQAHAGELARGGSGAGGTAAGSTGTSGKSSESGGTGETSGGTSGTNGTLPEDRRPPPPSWEPPFTIGEPGWRDSIDPLCVHRQGPSSALDVWADERGVFALIAQACRVRGRDLPSCAPEDLSLAGISLNFNDGSGWRSLWESPDDQNHALALAGLPDGPAVLTGGACGLTFVDVDGSTACAEEAFQSRTRSAVFGVDAERAYAVNDVRVLEYADGAWSELSTLPEPATAIWADRESVIVAGQNQAIYRKSEGDAAFLRLPNIPFGDYVSVWSFGPDDLWFGNAAGQLVHYDGARWTAITVGGVIVNDYESFSLWGNSGQLFFLSDTRFGRFDGETIEVLIEAPRVEPGAPQPLRFRSLWGVSPAEVYITLEDYSFDSHACGGEMILWFDGQTLHRF